MQSPVWSSSFPLPRRGRGQASAGMTSSVQDASLPRRLPTLHSRHSRTPSATPAPPPSLPHPLRHSRTPYRHSRTPSATPAPPSVTPAPPIVIPAPPPPLPHPLRHSRTPLRHSRGSGNPSSDCSISNPKLEVLSAAQAGFGVCSRGCATRTPRAAPNRLVRKRRSPEPRSAHDGEHGRRRRVRVRGFRSSRNASQSQADAIGCATVRERGGRDGCTRRSGSRPSRVSGCSP